MHDKLIGNEFERRSSGLFMAPFQYLTGKAVGGKKNTSVMVASFSAELLTEQGRETFAIGSRYQGTGKDTAD
jgi:hypothetical protein